MRVGEIAPPMVAVLKRPEKQGLVAKCEFPTAKGCLVILS